MNETLPTPFPVFSNLHAIRTCAAVVAVHVHAGPLLFAINPDTLLPLQGTAVTSIGLNITLNSVPVALKQQTQKSWKVLQLQPQLQPHNISLVSTTAGFFNQPQNCRLRITAIAPPPMVSSVTSGSAE
jgi:hypothetical protein